MDLLALAVILVVTCFAPGFFVVRSFGWRGDETIAVSIALSLILVYVTSFAIFVLGLPNRAHGAVFLLSLAAMGVSARSLTAVIRAPEARLMAATLGGVLAWTGALLAVVRSFSGGGWSFDWVEHYQRALFFLQRWGTGVEFIGGYVLPARPPMANLLSAHFMAFVGTSFAGYQLVLAVLSALAAAPVFLFARRFSPTGDVPVAVLLAFLAFNPMFVQNVTYPWTKLVAAFFVLIALHLYLEGWRAADRTRMTVAGLAIGAGIVCHYSAAPFALLLALHYGFLRATRPRPRFEATAVIAAAVVLVLPWFVWSLANYGTSTTLASNTTVTSIERSGFFDNVRIVGWNLWNTLVPYWFRDVDTTMLLRQSRALGFLRDSFFLAYQSSLTASLGLFGAVLAVMAVLFQRRNDDDRATRPFWVLFVVGGTVLGIAVYGFVDEFGVAQICLQPLVLLALARLAACFCHWPSNVRWLVCAGLAIDLAFGIFLHIALEAEAPPLGLNSTAAQNWMLKQRLGLEFIGDRAAAAAPFIAGFVVVAATVILRAMMVDRREMKENG